MEQKEAFLHRKVQKSQQRIKKHEKNRARLAKIKKFKSKDEPSRSNECQNGSSKVSQAGTHMKVSTKLAQQSDEIQIRNKIGKNLFKIKAKQYVEDSITDSFYVNSTFDFCKIKNKKKSLVFQQ